jgi:hypothetical protein
MSGTAVEQRREYANYVQSAVGEFLDVEIVEQLTDTAVTQRLALQRNSTPCAAVSPRWSRCPASEGSPGR